MRDIPFARPILGEPEMQAVQSVLEGHIYVHGPRVKEFEASFAEWVGAKKCTAVSSCTAGLHLAYFNKGIGVGDEVIVPAMSHVATAHAVEFTGATCVFVDAEYETGNIDIDKIESAITEKTRAISIVHYLGMPVAMDRVIEIAKKYKLFVVEDCALAVGSLYKGVHAGLLGDIGCFSFYPVKHMTTAEGGVILSVHDDVIDAINKKKAFGVNRTHTERSIPGDYDVDLLGYNYRMNELQAVIGFHQVKRLDSFISIREENFNALKEGIEGIEGVSTFKSTHGDFKSSYYCFSLLLDEDLAPNRQTIMASLKEKGVGTSIYYPRSIPCFTYYQEKYGHNAEDFPIASKISSHSIALPVGPHLGLEDMEYIVESLKEVISKNK